MTGRGEFMARSASVFAISTLLTLSAITGSSSQDLYYGGFDGTWKGKIDFQRLDFKTPDKKGSADERGLSIVISGGNVRVFIEIKNEMVEVKPGQFHLQTHKTNALIYAIDSSTDVLDKTGSGGWVEAWTYTVTHKDQDTLYVYFVRSVNNYLKSADKENARFFQGGFTEITRSK
jgi:hypothetical protein